MRAPILVSLLLIAAGCDRFDPPAAGAAPAPGDQARSEARAAMSVVMKAASTAAASCVAGELRWEPDEAIASFVGGEGSRYVPPEITHFSRPCIPERCAPSPAEVDALGAAARAMRSLVDGSPDLRVPSYQGFVAIAEAMVGFVAAAGPGSTQARMSGLSMHHAALATAFRTLVPGADVPLHPPALVASLAVAQPGGDPCKGWRIRRLCDVRGVRVPKEIRWRTDPPCIEVESFR